MVEAAGRETNQVGLALTTVLEAGRYAERVQANKISLLHQRNGCTLHFGTVADGPQDTVAGLTWVRLGSGCTRARRLRRFRRVLRHARQSRREAELGRVASEAGPVGPLRVQHGLGMRRTVNCRGVLIAVREPTLRRSYRLEGCHVVALAGFQRLFDKDLANRWPTQHLVGGVSVADVHQSLVLGRAARGVYGEQVVGAGSRLVARVRRLVLLGILFFLNGESVRINLYYGASSSSQGHTLHALRRGLAR